MTLPEDLRRQRRYDDGASIETLMLLDEAADAIETFEARQKTAMQFDDPGGTLVWSPAEMVDLLQTMAQSAHRRTMLRSAPRHETTRRQAPGQAARHRHRDEHDIRGPVRRRELGHHGPKEICLKLLNPSFQVSCGHELAAIFSRLSTRSASSLISTALAYASRGFVTSPASDGASSPAATVCCGDWFIILLLVHRDLRRFSRLIVLGTGYYVSQTQPTHF
jgi:hypothetical protein